jgi:hypothetical protein
MYMCGGEGVRGNMETRVKGRSYPAHIHMDDPLLNVIGFILYIHIYVFICMGVNGLEATWEQG